VKLSGSYGFVADELAGLQIIDLRDPASPRRVGGTGTVYASEVVVVGSRAYVVEGGAEGRLVMLDVSDPTQPQQLGSVAAGRNVSALAVAGDYAYMGDGLTSLGINLARLHVIDIREPTNPRRVGRSSLLGRDVRALAVSGEALLAAAGNDGLVVFDLFKPILAMDPAVRLEGGSLGLSVHGPIGQRVRIQQSKDLREWADWQTVELGEGPTDVADFEAAVHAWRFYRAVAP
jgi:hypothetical protein